MELVGGIVSVKGSKKYRHGGFQFLGDAYSAKAHRGKPCRNGLNLLRVCHPVRQALPTHWCNKEWRLTYSKVKEPTKAALAQRTRFRPSRADGAADAALLVASRAALKRVLLATDAAVLTVASEAQLFYRVNAEQSSRVAMLVRILKVKVTVDDQRFTVIPSKDADEKPLFAKRPKELLNFLPFGLRHAYGND